MPLAVIAATNEPALVPTKMSKSVTERLTDSRSSARSAPISYTAPVKPPPPSTSAVLEGLPRALRPPGDPATMSPLSALWQMSPG